jgi:hypothetical protein
MKAAQRLLAATQIVAREDVQVSEWWTNLPAEQQRQYIDEHPNSKYADQAIKEGKENKQKHGDPQQEAKEPTDDVDHNAPSSEQRKKMGAAITKSAPKIASILKRTFPKISAATSALAHLGTGKPLTHEHKEVIHELGGIALKTALTHSVGPHAAKALGQIGITAVNYAMEKFHEHKQKKPDQDDVQTFVEAVGEGVEKAEVAPVPKEHAEPGSHFRSAIGKHIKKSVKHIVAVIDQSFKDVKPATQGLVAFAKGESMSPVQTKALKHLGKFALGTAIATLPGGLAAHLAAGAGTAALTHAYKVMRSGEHHGSIVHRFVEAIGEGLEDAIIESGEGNEGHGGHE